MKVSIIICTYNEEKTIEDVLVSCCKNNPDSEIIVIDDGSVDNTEKIINGLLKVFSFKYEKLEENKGKSWAMVHGVEISTNEIILFFDADVSNIKKEHFVSLLNPILDNNADMVLGQPSETLIDYRVNPFKVLTGERALLKKDIVPVLNEIRNIRFGVETFINLYYQAKGKRIKYVLLKELKHPSTYEKSDSVVFATKKYFKESKEIALTLINNYVLINQSVELFIRKGNTDIIKKINVLQIEINNKLHELKKKMNL